MNVRAGWVWPPFLRVALWAIWALWALSCLSHSSAQASALTLAKDYHPQLDLRQYWVSEKYDGIRAHWTGTQLLSRQGLPIDAPPWFTKGWPRTALDGELWAGRDTFALVQSTVAQGRPQSEADHARWRQLRYMVFDLPQQPGPFTARQQVLQTTVARINQPWVQAVPQWQADSHSALMRELRALSRAGAEGLMLRHAQAPYRAGRSEDLIKLKLWDDAEAVVTGYAPGKGKYAGQVGALWVTQPNGLRFKIGSGLSDADRAQPPPIGSTITYRFNGIHPSGVPRFARYWRIREAAAP